jgi:hypothetical protein
MTPSNVPQCRRPIRYWFLVTKSHEKWRKKKKRKIVLKKTELFKFFMFSSKQPLRLNVCNWNDFLVK